MPHIILTSAESPNALLPFLPGFRDDFNRADGPLIATSNGRVWTFSQSVTPRADLQIRGNAATVVVESGATGNVAGLVETRASDGVLSAVLKTKGNQAGSLIVRGASLNDCIEISLRISGSALRPAIYARQNGARSELATSPAGTVVADGSRFDVVYDGPNIVVYINGVPIMAAVSTIHQTLTKAGVYAYASGPDIAWDDLRVTA